MSDQVFPIKLGGKSWDLPPLPFRVVKKIQGKLVLFTEDVARSGDLMSIVRKINTLGEGDLDTYIGLLSLALCEVDKEATIATLNDLTFSTAELMQTMPELMKACGLEFKPVQPGDVPEKK